MRSPEPKLKPNLRRDWEATWELLDANCDGSISQEELVIALEACGMKLSPWELRDMIEKADTNGDGASEP